MDEHHRGPDLTPLIDVIFLLIVFFLLTPAVTGRKIEVNLPEYSESEELSAAASVITVDSDNIIYINDRKALLSDLPGIFNQIIENRPEAESLLIRSDRESSFGIIVNIMDMASEAGLRSVSFSVTDSRH